MKTKNLRIGILTAVMLVLWMSPVRAALFNLGGTYSSNIPLFLNGVFDNEAGGSIDNSTLNGRATWVYCVDLFDNVYAPGTYNYTVVSTTGVVNGQTVDNAGQVAWLLDHYGTTGQTTEAMALQAAIWHVIYDGSAGYAGAHTVTLDTSVASAALTTEYNNMLSALGNNTAAISSVDWVTPNNGSTMVFQGLVTSAVPEPATVIAGAAMLLPFGVSVLRMLRRKEAA